MKASILVIFALLAITGCGRAPRHAAPLPPSDYSYVAGPYATARITPEMAKARCRMMVEGRGHAWIATGWVGLMGLANGEPFAGRAENRRKAQIDTCMIANGYQRAD